MALRRRWLWLPAIALIAASASASVADPSVRQTEAPYLTFGMFLASVEEGGRVFGPIEFLPLDHPASEGHQFPNPGKFHESQTDTLSHLGRLVGLKLEATLTRYPAPPDDSWAYPEFRPPPLDSIRAAEVIRAKTPATLPGLRIAAFRNGFPLAFILDTRGMSLDERGMQRPTSMGLDLTRDEFLIRLREAGDTAPREGTWIVTFPSTTEGGSLSTRARAELFEYWTKEHRTPEDYVVEKFEDNDWVFIGEYHRIRHDVELVSSLVSALHAKTDVRHLALEFLCRDRTDEANRLIAADTLERKQLVRFFREQFPGWAYEEYLDIFEAAWASNREHAATRGRFGLVGLHPCPDRELINYGTDPDAIRREQDKQDRYDEIMAEALEQEVLRSGVKALVFTGIAHATAKFTEYRFGTDQPLPRMGNLVYKEPYRAKMFFIALHAPFWDSARQQEIYPFDGAIDRLMLEFGKDIGFDVVGTPFESLSHRSTDRHSITWYRFGELVDGYIVFETPMKDYVGVTCIPDWIEDEAAFETFRRNLTNKRASESYALIPFEEFNRDRCAPGPDHGVEFRRRFRNLPGVH